MGAHAVACDAAGGVGGAPLITVCELTGPFRGGSSAEPSAARLTVESRSPWPGRWYAYTSSARLRSRPHPTCPSLRTERAVNEASGPGHVTTRFHQRHHRGERCVRGPRRTNRRGADEHTQAHDRRCAGPSVEGGVAGLAVGARPEAAAARAVHHRKAGAADGRGWRRPRRGGSAVLAWRPQRLWTRGCAALSAALRSNGAHSARKA